MSIERVPVVIVGAGPTGVTCATLLAQYGIESVLLERWAGVYPAPRAVHLDDEVYRIIARLGAAERFAAISRPAKGLRLIDRTGHVLAEFCRDTQPGVHGFPQANMFDQPELEAVLRANLEHYPAARLRGNAEVTSLAPTSSGPVRIQFTDRTDGTMHRIDADYVLGCDGANSVVRQSIGVQMTDLDFDQRWLVVDIATDADLNQWEGVHQLCDSARAGTYMRIGERRYRWEFRLLPGESAADFATVAALQPLISRWTAQVNLDRLELIRVTEYTFRATLAQRWRRGRIFLLGDAAHLTPPFIGQGLGAGLRDAHNIAWKLAAVIRGDLPATALDTYEAERKPHARSMIRLALTVGRAMTAGGETGNRLRHAAVPLLVRLPGLGARVVDSTTPALHASAYVRRRFGCRLVGTLYPEFALTGGYFVIISRVPLTPDQQALAERRGATTHLVAPGSPAEKWLRGAHTDAVLVRPDNTVMASGRDITALCRLAPSFRAVPISNPAPRL